MYENLCFNEKQTLQNGDSKLSQNQFTKSLTSFHTKKTLSKNSQNQNPVKKAGATKQEKSVKTKSIYLSR
jgi:hypothetical protein